MSLEDLYFSVENGNRVMVEQEQRGDGRGGSGNCSRNVICERIKIF